MKTSRLQDGKMVHAKYLLLFPMTVRQRTIKLKTFVLPEKVLFLIGVEAFRKLNAKLTSLATAYQKWETEWKQSQAMLAHHNDDKDKLKK